MFVATLAHFSQALTFRHVFGLSAQLLSLPSIHHAVHKNTSSLAVKCKTAVGRLHLITQRSDGVPINLKRERTDFEGKEKKAMVFVGTKVYFIFCFSTQQCSAYKQAFSGPDTQRFKHPL